MAAARGIALSIRGHSVWKVNLDDLAAALGALCVVLRSKTVRFCIPALSKMLAGAAYAIKYDERAQPT